MAEKRAAAVSTKVATAVTSRNLRADETQSRQRQTLTARSSHIHRQALLDDEGKTCATKASVSGVDAWQVSSGVCAAASAAATDAPTPRPAAPNLSPLADILKISVSELLRLQTIDLLSMHLADGKLAQLSSCLIGLHQVKNLWLANNRFGSGDADDGEEGTKAFIERSMSLNRQHRRSVPALVLSSANMSFGVVARNIAAMQWLTSLTLHNNVITGSAMEAHLAPALSKLQSLQLLSLHSNPLENVGLVAFAKVSLPTMTSLQCLSLDATGADDAAAAAVFAAIASAVVARAQPFRKLSLQRNRLTDASLTALVLAVETAPTRIFTELLLGGNLLVSDASTRHVQSVLGASHVSV